MVCKSKRNHTEEKNAILSNLVGKKRNIYKMDGGKCTNFRGLEEGVVKFYRTRETGNKIGKDVINMGPSDKLA